MDHDHLSRRSGSHAGQSRSERISQADHRRASAALPWLLNGTATEAERCFVEAHLSGCESCRAEWQRQQRLHAAMTAPSVPEPGSAGPLGASASPQAPDAQAGLQRLWARIDTADSLASEPAGGRRRTLPFGRFRGSSALVHGLLATVMVEAVALLLLVVAVYPATEPPADYETLSAAPAVATQQGSHRVVFDGSLTLAAMQQLLQQTGLQVVSGPNLAGAFLLAPVQTQVETQVETQVPAPALAQTQVRTEAETPIALLARLRAAPGVRLAELVANTGQGARP